MTEKMDARFANGPHVATANRRPRHKQARRIIASLISPLATLAFAAALTSPAHALTVQEQGWQVANSKCNSGDAKQCELRDRLSVVLKRHGCVYHEDGNWWKCGGH
jgi:invasion protein IalB